MFALAVAANLVVLYWPHVETPGGLPYVDKVGHVVAFAAVAWTARRAGLFRRSLVPVLVAHAVVSEVVQHTLLPGRRGDPADVVADVIGVALGLLGGTGRYGRVGDG